MAGKRASLQPCQPLQLLQLVLLVLVSLLRCTSCIRDKDIDDGFSGLSTDPDPVEKDSSVERIIRGEEVEDMVEQAVRGEGPLVERWKDYRREVELSRAPSTTTTTTDASAADRIAAHHSILEDIFWNRPHHRHGYMDTVQCHTSVWAGNLTKQAKCPESCPFWAEDVDLRCVWQCVEKEECGKVASTKPNETIAEEELMTCREKARHPGCTNCTDESCDVCTVCKEHYILENKVCRHTLLGFEMITLALFCLVFTIGVLYLLWISCMPIVNQEGLDEGLVHRSRSKLRMPVKPPSQRYLRQPANNRVASDDHFSHANDPFRARASVPGMCPVRKLWPLTTNLTSELVAGAGLNLHFRFQVAIIAWVGVVTLAWVLYAASIDYELFISGAENLHLRDQRKYCTLIARDALLRREVMGEKRNFLFGTYIFSFAFFAVLVTLQLRQYYYHEKAELKDFAAFCEGLPICQGNETAEREVKEFLEDQLEEKVVGVSICWDFGSSSKNRGQAERVNELLKNTFKDSGGDDEVERLAPSAKELLHSLQSTSKAYVIFDSQPSRNAAIARSRDKDVVLRGKKIHLSPSTSAPNMVTWEHFGVSNVTLIKNIIVGVCFIVFVLALWFCGVYAPYIYYDKSFSYAEGEMPNFKTAAILSFIVVGGNQMMYVASDAVARRVGFKQEDHQQAMYVVLYFFAVLMNIGVDIWICAGMAQRKIEAFHNTDFFGLELSKMASVEELLKAYPMQRRLGQELFTYSFPATFLIPFMLEPIFSVWVPYLVAVFNVRINKNCRGDDAIAWLQIFTPMDMSRYADILLNVTLVVMMLATPSGYILPSFGLLFLCLIYIYFLDHYRVLRLVPSFAYESRIVDRVAMVLLGFPLAILLTTAVAQEAFLKEREIVGLWFWFLLGSAFVLHMLLHILVIIGIEWSMALEEIVVTESYAEAASCEPYNYFNTNPVNCLRSKYIFEHRPACMPYVPGKEHLLEPNRELGLYFRCLPAVPEWYASLQADDYDDASGIFAQVPTWVSGPLNKRAQKKREAKLKAGSGSKADSDEDESCSAPESEPSVVKEESTKMKEPKDGSDEIQKQQKDLEEEKMQQKENKFEAEG
eukprot:TRINITY_DN93579_c0_g1_i1.p1 TRINITY_DN93579_c0_g1~~TRINITY_DN93579_c0_g1_i1.p1  ORF type:complete len:1101 (+),score=166.08 TRINITY_DN93579_c0_g1_i1:103-3405(+)